MNSGSSSEEPQNQELDCSQNNRPATTSRTENVWLTAVSDIIKHDSNSIVEPVKGFQHHLKNNPAELQNQNASFFHSKQSDIHSGSGAVGIGNLGSSIKAFNLPSPFESSELGKKRTRRNLVTEENSLDDILSQSNFCSII